MSGKITLQVEIDKKLNKDLNANAKKKGQAKWVAVERGIHLYNEECKKEDGKK